MSEKIHLTRQGYQQLFEEVRRLKSQERPRIVREIKAAREHGDLSENAEYHAAKEHQGHVEGRIQMLEHKLAHAVIVETSGQSGDRVLFGATVVLEDRGSGERVTYTLVGEEEADISRGLLSVRSPVGRALIGKLIEEEVAVRVPAGVRQYQILEIRFE